MACALALLAGGLSLAATLPAGASPRLSVRLLTRVPPPGFPSASVIGADGLIYVSTFKSFTAPSNSGPSKVFAFTSSGHLRRTYTITGQTPGQPDAVQVATRDRAGTLYLLDQSPARVVRLDPRSGRQRTWASFASLPACSSAPAGAPCSDGQGRQPPEPDFAAWGPDGSLYVTDYNQALIWRIPPGGGPAIPWLTDSRLNGIIVGPAGIALMPGGHALMFSNGGNVGGLASGQIYTVPIEPDGEPGPLHQVWQSTAAQAPDGFALARSGDIYVSLVGPSGNAVEEVSPSGHEIALVPANPVANQAMIVPFDAPGSVTFDGENLIVTNGASLSNDSSHWALLEITAGEAGLAPSLPPGPPARARRARYALRLTPRRTRVCRLTRFRFLALRIGPGRRTPVAGARISFAGHRLRTGREGRATLLARITRAGRYRARWRRAHGVRATATVLVRR